MSRCLLQHADMYTGPSKAGLPGSSRAFRVHAAGIHPAASTLGSQASQVLQELASLYKGVVGAATGAGIILAAYFSFYSTAKQFLRRNTDLSDGGRWCAVPAGTAGRYHAGGSYQAMYNPHVCRLCGFCVRRHSSSGFISGQGAHCSVHPLCAGR